MYVKSYVWSAHAGNGRGSHTGTDTARTGGFGTLNIPREALGYAVQHGGDRHSVVRSSVSTTGNREAYIQRHRNGTLSYSYAQFYPRASGAHGRLTVPAVQNDSALVLFNIPPLRRDHRVSLKRSGT